MFSNISEQITDKLLENKIIENENRNLYNFAIQQTLIMMLNVLTSLLLGIIIHMIGYTILFMISFIPLRIFAGGVHAKTPIRCYAYSMIILTMILLIMKYTQFHMIIYITLYLISSILILLLAPVEDLNKKLDNDEKPVYRKRTIIIWIVESVILLIGILLNFEAILCCFMVSMFSISILVILGKVKNKHT